MAGTWIKFRHLTAKPLILLDDENNLYESTNAVSISRIILPIALAGSWCAPGIREGGGDLPPWKRFHGPEGARQAGMPGGSATAYRRCSAPEADGAPYVPRRKWRCGTCARPNVATDTGRAGVGSARSFLRIRARFNCPPVFPPSINGQTLRRAWR